MIQNDNLSLFEGMTSISALIRAAEARPETARKIVNIIYSNEIPYDKKRQVAFLRAKSELLGFSLEAVPLSEIDALADGKSHGGFLAFCGDRSYLPLSDKTVSGKGVYFLLEGIEDPYNFGYTLRSLYAAGADGVVLPERNWLSAAGTVARSSAGTSELIDVFIGDTEASAAYFKQRGYRIACANIRDSVSLYDADLTAPLLIVIGGEKRGISRNLLSLSDLNIRIGYGREFAGSLPTAQAAAIFAFEAAKFNKLIK